MWSVKHLARFSIVVSVLCAFKISYSRRWSGNAIFFAASSNDVGKTSDWVMRQSTYKMIYRMAQKPCNSESQNAIVGHSCP